MILTKAHLAVLDYLRYLWYGFWSEENLVRGTISKVSFLSWTNPFLVLLTGKATCQLLINNKQVEITIELVHGEWVPNSACLN